MQGQQVVAGGDAGAAVHDRLRCDPRPGRRSGRAAPRATRKTGIGSLVRLPAKGALTRARDVAGARVDGLASRRGSARRRGRRAPGDRRAARASPPCRATSSGRRRATNGRGRDDRDSTSRADGPPPPTSGARRRARPRASCPCARSRYHSARRDRAGLVVVGDHARAGTDAGRGHHPRDLLRSRPGMPAQRPAAPAAGRGEVALDVEEDRAGDVARRRTRRCPRARDPGTSARRPRARRRPRGLAASHSVETTAPGVTWPSWPSSRAGTRPSCSRRAARRWKRRWDPA